MRLFIAIDLPPHVRRAAADMAAQLRAYGARGRFVPPENYHVTLRFIGESDALPDAVEAMRSAVRDGRPFLLRLGGDGAFPGRAGCTWSWGAPAAARRACWPRRCRSTCAAASARS